MVAQYGATVLYLHPLQQGDYYIIAVNRFYSNGVVPFGTINVESYHAGSSTVDYSINSAYWATNTPSWASSVVGILQTTVNTAGTSSTSAYGTGLKFQEAQLPHDWEILGFSGNSKLPEASSSGTGSFVAKSGDTMTGALILYTNTPATNNEAASKKYVDDSVAAAGGGDMLGNGLRSCNNSRTVGVDYSRANINEQNNYKSEWIR